MKRFKSIEAWLETNPSQEEIDKVLILIHRGEGNRTRKAIYEKDSYLRKLYRSVSYLEKVKIPIPKDLSEEIKGVKAQIEILKKDLPAPMKRAKEKASVE